MKIDEAIELASAAYKVIPVDYPHQGYIVTDGPVKWTSGTIVYDTAESANDALKIRIVGGVVKMYGYEFDDDARLSVWYDDAPVRVIVQRALFHYLSLQMGKVDELLEALNGE